LRVLRSGPGLGSRNGGQSWGSGSSIGQQHGYQVQASTSIIHVGHPLRSSTV